ncbi:MAG: flagellar biosynthesis anti-sigma factor FlgM [Methylococcales bacterium]|jgi:negative regulator of flagellin synthesis FlgM|nr:flagellar biosynthesis anti-sigma factor FlgM [Methylococcales bacterium]MBT7444496.1 flagellar biosynthesis anti-sigma factor FlgM [Methylococcales bacterium]
MAIDFNSIGGRAPVSQPDNPNVSGDKTLREPTSAQQSTGGTSTTDTVSITDNANQLQALENNVAQLPVVDTQRVEAAKAAIANGNYEANPTSIADKILSFEAQLGG